jgi:FkbM family methyltransferase
MGTIHQNEPFGAFALPPARERMRTRATRYADTRTGRWAISACRKWAIRGLDEPFDVTVAPGVLARLYPAGNRCEKRALAGVQIWDADERHALKQAIESGSGPFVFLDVGANVGLYSLFVNAYAKTAGRPVRLIAVEPSDEMAARLQVNAQASGAAIEHVSAAISDAPGQARLSGGSGNHGEAMLGETGPLITVETLMGLCDRLHLSRIDALKLDIEGHDERALRAFFNDAPERLHPKLLIVETSQQNSPLIEMAQAQNYLLENATALNAILKKR